MIYALLYLGAMAVCLLFIIKPGASIFYFKTRIDSQAVIPDAGYAFRYDLDISPFIFRTADILVYEDGHQLNSTDGNIVVEEGMNAYAISRSSTGTTHIYFASSDNSNPISNHRSYTIYIPVNLISRTKGLVYLAFLLPGLIWLIYFMLSVPGHRKLLRSPKGIIEVYDRFNKYFPRVLKPDLLLLRQQIKARRQFWKQLFTISILVGYIYVFMEWVFFVTMPSLMSILSLPDKLEVFLLSGLGLSLLNLAGIIIFIIKVTKDAKGWFILDSQQVKPPFFQFSMLNIIDCQRWYQLDLTTNNWLSGDVDRYINPCSEDSLLIFDEIKQLVTQQLLKNGFDVSSLL